MDINPVARAAVRPYSDDFIEAAYDVWRSDAGRNNFSETSKLIDVDRGTISRWARDHGWWQRHTMESSTMSTQDERRVVKTLAEMNGPAAISLIINIINGDVDVDKVRLDAAKTLLNRIGFPEMKITEYVERAAQQEEPEKKPKRIEDMTEEEMIAEQRRLTEPQER